MPLVKAKPTSPGRRFVVSVSTPELHKGKPHTALLEVKRKNGGRNNAGRITTRHQGGGHKQQRRYILAPKGVKAGDEIRNGSDAPIKPGNAMPMRNIPVGSLVHNIELKRGKGGQLARSAGSSAQLVARTGEHATLRLRSGEMRKVLADCVATIGEVGNVEHSLRSLGKAGATRWHGKRPTVRGVAMNPVDHPHGGGEGRTSGGRHPVSPWGMPTKGYRTRKNKRTDSMIVRRRNKK
jgi:large subunit ribosomal protein L2